MRVLVVTSQKGGSGKTTLSGHLAVQAERTGAGPVAVLDTDPQGSLTRWCNARQSPTPVLLRASGRDLPGTMVQLRDRGAQLVIIDTPPAITSTIAEVVRIADLVLIPIRPSPHDLGAAGATIELVENLGKRLVFVVNGASPRARITTQAAIALSQHGTVAPDIIHNRTDFASSMIDGRTVMEVPKSARSSREIALLWDYLRPRISKNENQPSPPTRSTLVRPNVSRSVEPENA